MSAQICKKKKLSKWEGNYVLAKAVWEFPPSPLVGSVKAAQTAAGTGETRRCVPPSPDFGASGRASDVLAVLSGWQPTSSLCRVFPTAASFAGMRRRLCCPNPTAGLHHCRLPPEPGSAARQCKKKKKIMKYIREGSLFCFRSCWWRR